MAAGSPGATTTVRSAVAGDDRLYVRGVDGRRLGWYDLRSGATQLLDPDPGAAATVQAAVDAYVAAVTPLRRRPTTGAPVPAPRTPSDGRGGHDRRGADPSTEDLRDRSAGEHVTRRLVARARARALAPAGRTGWAPARDPLGPGLRHEHHAAVGQQRVGAVLAGLPSTWHVMHCVPTAARSCLDHLLVGPGGVVVLRTAAHPSGVLRITGETARVDGRPVSHVRLLRRQAALVLDRLHAAAQRRGADRPARVRGVVVVVGARSVRADDLPAGVSVVRLGDLTRWVRDLPTVLSQVEVARLAATAARPSTWPTEPDVPTGLRLRQEQRRSDRAALVRLSARARDAARWTWARRVAVVAGVGAVAAWPLLLLRPELVPPVLAALAGG